MARTTIDDKNSNGIVAVMISAWAVIALIVFLSYRGSDIGQLQRLIGNLGGGPLFGFEGFLDSIAGGLIALAIVISWLGLGSFITTGLRSEKATRHSHILKLVISTAAGAAIWSLIWFFFGLFGLYNPWAAGVAIFIGLILLAFGFRHLREARAESRIPKKPSNVDRVLIVLIAIPVVLALVGALAPPTAKDTLLYHFAVPKAFIAQGSNAFVEGNIASYLALGVEMHNVWAMLLGGIVNQRTAEAAAGAVNWTYFPLLLAAVFGWARELDVSRRWALLAVLVVATVPSAYHVASSAYIDIALALYVTLAIYAMSRWWKSLELGWLILLATFLGAALSIKLTSAFISAAVALVILLRARKEKENSAESRKIVALGFGALLLAGVIASPWYLRTWNATGSPVFPFYMSIWKGEAPGWDIERSNQFQTMNAGYGGADKSPIDYALAPWNLSVAAQPEHAEYFDGVLGVSFLFGLPTLLWALWKFDLPVQLRIGTGVAAIMFLFWLFSSQQLRYLLPIVPVLAIATVAAAEKISERERIARSTFQISFVATSIVALLVSIAWFLQRSPLRVVLGGESRDAFLARNLDYYPFYQFFEYRNAI